MRKERVEYLIDSFVDANGNERKYVICGVSEVLPYEEENCTSIDVLYQDCDDSNYICSVRKGLRTGVAFCNLKDIFNKEMGKRIAYGRAKKNANWDLFVTDPGFIYTEAVQLHLKRLSKFIKDNPENAMKRYSRMK